MRRGVVFSAHAANRMFERAISADDVIEVVERGEVIEDYPDDTPYPSRLVLGYPAGRPLHVVVADSAETDESIAITVYEPDPARWDQRFRRRTI